MFSFLLLHFVFIYETKAECTAVYYFGEKLQPKPDLFFRIWQHNRSPLSLKSAAPHVSSVALIRWVLISHRSVPSIRFKLDFASAAGFLLSNSYWIIKGEATLRHFCSLCTKTKLSNADHSGVWASSYALTVRGKGLLSVPSTSSSVFVLQE